MPDTLHTWLLGLAAIVPVAVAVWAASLPLRDASIVDRFWPLLFVAAAAAYASQSPPGAPRRWWVLALLAAWALRLGLHITWRNWGHGEDRRYQAIRARNQPGFAWKSLPYVFLLQALLAWVISLPLLAALRSAEAPGLLDAAGLLAFVLGFACEALGDWQLARFRASRPPPGTVLDTGLWRYTRHPNYFGECLLWWGFGLMALATGAWWALAGPLLLTVLLVRVSGVALLERDMAERRPAYREYVRRTSAFIPWPPRAAATPPAGAGSPS